MSTANPLITSTMFAAWSVCAILFASCFVARAAPLQDDPLVKKVKEIIADVDDYLATHNQEELNIPHYPDFSNPIQLTNGKISNVSTIVLQDGSSVKETKEADNSTVYVFNLKLGLQDLQYHYNFLAFTEYYLGTGSFSLSVQDNSAEVTGYATVQSDNTCKAVMLTLKATKLGNYQLKFQSKSIPDSFSQYVLSYMKIYLSFITEIALEGPLYSSLVQQSFSEFACKRLISM